MIQARHITFNIQYGTYIKPLEEMITKKSRYKVNFGKGNYDTIAKKIAHFTSKYKYYTEADHSVFDAHITVEMLSLTHKFYQACYYHNKELRELSRQTLYNKCRTRQGDRYTCRGTRMSGDVDTSLGNSLINYALIKEVLFKLGIEGDAIVNGDDSIIFTNKPLNIELATEYFSQLNMDTKLSLSTTNIHTVQYCQTKFVLRSDGTPTMMADPKRMYQRFGMTHTLLNHEYYPHYLQELMLCHSLTHTNTPLGYAWLAAFDRTRTIPLDRAYKLKWIDQEYYSAMEREILSTKSTAEYTQSMYQAYEHIDRYDDLIRNISIGYNYTDHHIYINHHTQTITTHNHKHVKIPVVPLRTRKARRIFNSPWYSEPIVDNILTIHIKTLMHSKERRDYRFHKEYHEQSITQYHTH